MRDVIGVIGRGLRLRGVSSCMCMATYFLAGSKEMGTDF